MGPSGSGKSTFFNMVGGSGQAVEGKVYIDEVDVAQLDAYELAWLRCRKIGYIFQSFNLIPVMTALENVTLPMVFAGLTSDEARDKGMELLRKVGLGSDTRINQTSCPVDSSSVWLWHVRWLMIRLLYWLMNQPPTSTYSTHGDYRTTARNEQGLRCYNYLGDT